LEQKGEEAARIAVTEEDLRMVPNPIRVQPVQDSLRAVASSHHEDRVHPGILEHPLYLVRTFPVLSRQKSLAPLEQIGPVLDVKPLGLDESDPGLERLLPKGARRRHQPDTVPFPQRGGLYQRFLRSHAQPYSSPCQ
jgi:hypothetical protein